MRQGWYEIAVICRNGHVINSQATSYPEMTVPFCPGCGAATLRHCLACRARIRGEYHLSGILTLQPYVPPAYCHGCGTPYPWTLQRLEAADALVDELEHLSLQDRELLKGSIADLVQDSPRSHVAALRVKRLLAKAGTGMAEVFRSVLVDVLSEATRRAIWG